MAPETWQKIFTIVKFTTNVGKIFKVQLGLEESFINTVSFVDCN